MSEAAIILAAGAGTRMKSKNSKVVHEILGKKLIDWVVDAARSAGIEDLVTVVGHRSDQVIEAVSDRSAIAYQKEMLGTADAVSCAMKAPQLADLHGSVVVLYGDTPLISPDTIRKLLDIRNEKKASCVVLTMQRQVRFCASLSRKMRVRPRRVYVNAIQVSIASMRMI